MRAIVLTGGETCFVAGADVREFASAGPIEMYLRHTEYLWDAIASCAKPVIAAVNGYALGGAVSLPCIATSSSQARARCLASLK